MVLIPNTCFVFQKNKKIKIDEQEKGILTKDIYIFFIKFK
jgi:hypothetical protein